VDAAYFFGAPAGDLPFEWRVYKQRSSFDIPGYDTGLYTTDWYSNTGNFGGEVASGKARTRRGRQLQHFPGRNPSGRHRQN